MQLLAITLVIIINVSHGISAKDLGNGLLHTLQAKQDVLLESSHRNYNNLNFLIVGNHPKKRSLIQFEDLSRCTHVKWAKMYLFFWYSHKASYETVKRVPYIPRTLCVHQVKQEWSETAATSGRRLANMTWSKPYLALDGTDAAPYPQDNGVTVFTGRPRGYIEFDVTEAVRNWKAGDPNYGLLIWATNENDFGREARFYSKERRKSKPYLNVLCDY